MPDDLFGSFLRPVLILSKMGTGRDPKGASKVVIINPKMKKITQAIERLKVIENKAFLQFQSEKSK